MTAILKLTDGTDEIDLLKLPGLQLEDWRPAIAEYKGGGTWRESALSDGRRLVNRQFTNVIETMSFKVQRESQDAAIESMQDVLRMLEKAADYWTADWPTEYVYIIAQASRETNARYAIVQAGRMPDIENPYRQPFLQPGCVAVMDNMTLLVERGHWMDNTLDDADCLEIGAQQEWCGLYPLVFDGDTSVVDVGSPAILDDLAAADFTVEAWIKPAGWGENNEGNIANKSANYTVGWSFHIDNVNGLQAFVFCDVTNAVSSSGLDDFSSDMFDTWHHVAMVFTFATKTIRLFVDGTEVTYSTQVPGNNNIVADAAADFLIGNLANGSRGFDGEIGWLQVVPTDLYVTDFEVEPHCVLPSIDTTFVSWLGICEGTGTTIYDLTGNGNNGTASNTTWGDCCESTYGTYSPDDGREETCAADTIYVANKHNRAGLTHILIEDGGLFVGDNLLRLDLPVALLPAVPAVNDRVYFGIQTTVVDSGPFCSLVFDLSQAQAAIADIVWEYWNGAWVALTVQDNTDADGAMTGAAFDTTGVKSVHWVQPADWTTTTVNGVTGYWVRAEVQDAGTQPPIQQNRHVYTVVWPYVEVRADKVGGDIPALIRQYIRNQSDDDLSNAPVLFSNRTIIGLRSMIRGENFTPYINLVSEQNPTGIGFSAGGGGATIVADVQTPTGLKLQCLNTPAADTVVGVIQFDDTISPEYYGKYHVFLRGYQYNGVPGNVNIHLEGTTGAATRKVITDRVPFQIALDWELLDMGIITFPFTSSIHPSETGYIQIWIYAYGDGAIDFDLYDLILMPVDEWVLDTADPDPSSPVSTALGYRSNDSGLNTYLDVDSISWPKNMRKTLLKEWDSDWLSAAWLPKASGAARAQANANQRYWFLHANAGTYVSLFEIVNSVQMWRLQRYLGARGAR